jgi:hypothetical protein
MLLIEIVHVPTTFWSEKDGKMQVSLSGLDPVAPIGGEGSSGSYAGKTGWD